MTPTPEQTRKCSNCMWWELWELYSDGFTEGAVGVCRGAPPTSNIFPHTRADDWCGSFRMKEPGQ